MIADCRELIKRIESGEVATAPKNIEELTRTGGMLRFRTEDGWLVVVVVVAGEWDYVDCFESPDGDTLKFDKMCMAAPDLAYYKPSPLDRRTHWGWTYGEVASS
jgi:hypothetical protein